MLQWVGKKPLDSVTAYPAQLMDRFDPTNAATPLEFPRYDDLKDNWQNLLFYGDNKDVLANLLANGFRGKVNLAYVDPPFNTGQDRYVRRVQFRGAIASRVEGEEMSLIEQTQYANAFFPDLYLQFMFERLLLLKELFHDDGVLVLRIDYHYAHYLKVIADETFGNDYFVNEILISRQRESAGSPNKLEVETESLFVYSKSRKPTFNKPKVRRSVANIQWTAFLMGGERFPRERKFLGKALTPPDGQHFSLNQQKVEQLLEERFLRVRCRNCGALHFYGKTQEELERFMRRKENRFKFYDIYSDRDYFGVERLEKCQSCSSENFAVEYLGSDEEAVANNWTDIPSYSQITGYPTENSEELLQRITETFSSENHLLLDCFSGSGTTAAAAQKLGRRWIAADINKGAIQTTSKRLQTIILEQIEKSKQGKLIKADGEIKPAALAFSLYRVNNYDLQIQHNEAANLAVEHLGVTRTRTDNFFDGTRGKQLVKIIPFNHPCTLLDLQLLDDELKKRNETRDVLVVCLGKESSADAWMVDWNKRRPVTRREKDGKPIEWLNKIELVELRTDKKYGGFFAHQPAHADVSIARKGDQVVIEIRDFISPTIVERLKKDETLFSVKIPDWRAMVDAVMIDTDYNGSVFNITHSDVPERKNDLVEGKYELPAPRKGATVAVKIVDMLGEEVLVTKQA